MTRTTKGSKAPTTEYWASRLSPGGETPGRITKTLTHRKERRESDRIAGRELDQIFDDTESEAYEESLEGEGSLSFEGVLRCDCCFLPDCLFTVDVASDELVAAATGHAYDVVVIDAIFGVAI